MNHHPLYYELGRMFRARFGWFFWDIYLPAIAMRRHIKWRMKLINWEHIIIVFIVIGFMILGAIFINFLLIAVERNRLQVSIIRAHEIVEAGQAEYIRHLRSVNADLWTLHQGRYQRDVIVTAYTARAEECGADPDHTASMSKPRPGIVAVSRDLFDAGWTFGRRVYLAGVGVYTIGDLMHSRHEGRIDVFIDDLGAAREFGSRVVQASLIAEG